MILPSYCSWYNQVICIRLNCLSDNFRIYWNPTQKKWTKSFNFLSQEPQITESIHSPYRMTRLLVTPHLTRFNPSSKPSMHSLSWIILLIPKHNSIVPNIKQLLNFQNHYLTIINPIKPNAIVTIIVYNWSIITYLVDLVTLMEDFRKDIF